MKNNREPELEQFRSIWLTKESYEILRDEKKKQARSMAAILDDLIKAYGEPFCCRGCKSRRFIKTKRLLWKDGRIGNYAMCGDCGKTNMFGSKYDVFFTKVGIEKSVPVRELEGEEIYTEENGEKVRMLRKQVEKRDGKVCAICGDKEAWRYQLDHKYPKFWGGGDELENLQILCLDCNSKKRMDVYLV